MNDSKVSLSIIIAAPPETLEPGSLLSLQRLERLSDGVEIIVARGRMPSVQRNQAAQQARGKWLWFLDDDSLVSEQTLVALKSWLQRTDADGVGGPSLCPAQASFVQRVFAVVMSSFLAFGPSRARYLRVGLARPSGEKELILCNLLIRRDCFFNHGGFDEMLYPNEENALLESMARGGSRLWYDPILSVDRLPRQNLVAFLRMIFRYGTGRAQQIRRHSASGSLLNVMPSLFSLYLWSLLIAMCFSGLQGDGWIWLILLTPLLSLILASLGECLVQMRHHPRVACLLAWWLIPCSLLAYGHGFIAGFLGRACSPEARQNKLDVELEIPPSRMTGA